MAGASSLGLLLSHLPTRWVGGVYAADAPETTKIRFGMIALTDCSSIVMAHELGLFKKYGIESTISKEASWAAIRDKLTLGENQATHMLFGMPFASSMGLLGSPVKPMIIPFEINHNGQAITLENDLKAKGVRTPQAIEADCRRSEKSRQADDLRDDFSARYPCHVDALLACRRRHQSRQGCDADHDPAAANGGEYESRQDGRLLRRRAVERPRHRRRHRLHRGDDAANVERPSGKGLGFHRRVRRKKSQDRQSDPARDDRVEPVYRQDGQPPAHVAEVVSKPQYINTQKEVILGRMLGDYDYGDGRKEKDPNYMTFFDRNTNFPWKSHGVWWLTQFRRWGMVKGAPDYTGIVNKVIRPDIYREVAKEMGVTVPKEDMKKETLFDKIEFDPAKPEEYVKKFAVSNVA